MTFPDNSGNTAIQSEQAGPAEQVGPVGGEAAPMTNVEMKPDEVTKSGEPVKVYSWTEPVPQPEPAVFQPPAPAPVINPLENEDMIRSLLARIADALVGASALSKRVEALTETVGALQDEMINLKSDLRIERDYAKSLDYDLTNTKAALKASQDYATECEKEIDKLKAERDDAMQGRAAALQDIEWVSQARDANEKAYTEAFDVWNVENNKLKAENEALKAQVQKQSDKIVRMLGALQE